MNTGGGILAVKNGKHHSWGEVLGMKNISKTTRVLFCEEKTEGENEEQQHSHAITNEWELHSCSLTICKEMRCKHGVVDKPRKHGRNVILMTP